MGAWFPSLDLLHHFAAICLTLLGLGGAYCVVLVALSSRRSFKMAGMAGGQARGLAHLVAPLTAQLGPRNALEMRQLTLQLNRAGMHTDSAVRTFGLVRLASVGLGIFLSALLWLLHFGALSNLGGSLALLYGGLKAPEWWLNQQVATRQERLRRALPAVIDLVVLCLDVGLSLPAAFERVTMEMRALEPLMADEAQAVVSEMNAGLTFPQALKRMAERVDLEDLITLARFVSQASQLGASMTHALREYSEQSFQKRLMALEEQAGKINGLLTIPLVLCMLPACILALIAPAAVSIAETFGH